MCSVTPVTLVSRAHGWYPASFCARTQLLLVMRELGGTEAVHLMVISSPFTAAGTGFTFPMYWPKRMWSVGVSWRGGHVSGSLATQELYFSIRRVGDMRSRGGCVPVVTRHLAACQWYGSKGWGGQYALWGSWAHCVMRFFLVPTRIVCVYI